MLNNPEPSDREDWKVAISGSLVKVRGMRNLYRVQPIRSKADLSWIKSRSPLVAEALMEMDAANSQMEEEKLFDGPLRPACLY